MCQRSGDRENFVMLRFGNKSYGISKDCENYLIEVEEILVDFIFSKHGAAKYSNTFLGGVKLHTIKIIEDEFIHFSSKIYTQ